MATFRVVHRMPNLCMTRILARCFYRQIIAVNTCRWSTNGCNYAAEPTFVTGMAQFLPAFRSESTPSSRRLIAWSLVRHKSSRIPAFHSVWTAVWGQFCVANQIVIHFPNALVQFRPKSQLLSTSSTKLSTLSLDRCRAFIVKAGACHIPADQFYQKRRAWLAGMFQNVIFAKTDCSVRMPSSKKETDGAV
ncbi:unnamed protein product [Protopolystoma xenopodis]|uniref:Uncharacterized protein n=1 Tax=Protopolystoma xenopodis TaxID=117903 RepID=A0A3S5B492_9PLAT|nr:unnamed protein product [Protopolystoma xenopodis]